MKGCRGGGGGSERKKKDHDPSSTRSEARRVEGERALVRTHGAIERKDVLKGGVKAAMLV